MTYSLVRNIVYTTNPRHLSTDVPIDTKIQVALRVDLDAVGFKKENVILLDVKGGATIPIDVLYEKRNIIVSPLSPLTQGAHYVLEIVGGEKGVQTVTGQVLEESWYMEFYTGVTKSVKAPKLTYPTDQTVVKSPITFKWDTLENVFYYHMQISDSNTFNHILWPTEPDINVFDGLATPDLAYENKRYYARIKAVNLLREESAWSDTIQFYVEEEEPLEQVEDEEAHDPAYLLESKCKVVNNELDALKDAIAGGIEEQTGLKVKSISVKNGSFNLPLNSIREFHIEFAEPIDKKSINSNTIYLLGERN